MKAIILAVGLGTRIAEESDHKPKPMVEEGGRPLLWHIMKIYSHHGIKDFIICLGYKGNVIKEFYFNYYRHMSNVCIDLKTGDHQILQSQAEDWRITLNDTGAETMTGGRLKRAARYLDNETFCLTYGDGLADIDITAELKFHYKHGKLATVAAVQPPGRFGVLNVGFFVLEPQVVNYIDGDDTSWERAPLANLAKDNQLAAFSHSGFWQPCDTLRDKRELERLWDQGNAPWCVWSRHA